MVHGEAHTRDSYDEKWVVFIRQEILPASGMPEDTYVSNEHCSALVRCIDQRTLEAALYRGPNISSRPVCRTYCKKVPVSSVPMTLLTLFRLLNSFRGLTTEMPDLVVRRGKTNVERSTRSYLYTSIEDAFRVIR